MYNVFQVYLYPLKQWFSYIHSSNGLSISTQAMVYLYPLKQWFIYIHSSNGLAISTLAMV